MKKVYLVKIFLLFIITAIIACLLFGIIRIHPIQKESSENVSFIQALGTGCNIGNSLDACDWSTMFESAYGNGTETFWGNPAISEEFIGLLEEQGFKTVRVPVTYMNHIDENGNIDEAWLDRVAEVVDMVIAHNMYCIINIHHDTGNDGWIKASEKNYEDNNERVKSMIIQIANRFKEYDNHLILESFNEMVDEKSRWSKVPISSYKAFNKWNQLFVDTVRATGDNNSDRYLLINTYAAAVDNIMIYYFDMPNDTVENRLIAGVHNYAGPINMEKSFAIIKSLSRRGYPVIIGEFGNTANVSYDRAEFVNEFIELCKENNYCPIWWDNGQDPNQYADSSFALFNRNTDEVYNTDIIKSLTGHE